MVRERILKERDTGDIDDREHVRVRERVTRYEEEDDDFLE